jgi:hypothetical protein
MKVLFRTSMINHQCDRPPHVPTIASEFRLPVDEMLRFLAASPIPDKSSKEIVCDLSAIDPHYGSLGQQSRSVPNRLGELDVWCRFWRMDGSVFETLFRRLSYRPSFVHWLCARQTGPPPAFVCAWTRQYLDRFALIDCFAGVACFLCCRSTVGLRLGVSS